MLDTAMGAPARCRLSRNAPTWACVDVAVKLVRSGVVRGSCWAASGDATNSGKQRVWRKSHRIVILVGRNAANLRGGDVVRTALAHLIRGAHRRQCRPVSRRPDPPLDRVRGGAALLVRKCGSGRVQRATDAVRPASGPAGAGGEDLSHS